MRTGIRLPGLASCPALFAAVVLPLVHPASASPVQGLTRFGAEEPHVGTLVRIDAYVPADAGPPQIFRAVFDRVAELEMIFSTYRPDSELRQLEVRAWRHAVPVSGELSELLGRALELARASGGAFDPTLGRATRLVRASGWGREGPASAALEEALLESGWQHVEIRGSPPTTYLSDRGLAMDLGGIAKGYIADQALAELARLGVERAIVAVAGDIAIGDPPPGEAGWTIALDAVGRRGTSERSLVLRNAGVSTSGSRERYYLRSGQRCSHIFAVGSPCALPASAVSVVAKDAALADGLATALAAAGPERSERLLQQYPQAHAYWASESPYDAPVGGPLSVRGPSQR